MSEKWKYWGEVVVLLLGNIDVLTQGLWEGIGCMQMVAPSSWGCTLPLELLLFPAS